MFSPFKQEVIIFIVPKTTLNTSLSQKISSENGIYSEGSYVKLDGIAFDEENGKLLLTKAGADTPIPFKKGDTIFDEFDKYDGLYTTSGLTPFNNRMKINSGGYYKAPDGYCYVKINLTPLVTFNGNGVYGFPRLRLNENSIALYNNDNIWDNVITVDNLDAVSKTTATLEYNSALGTQTVYSKYKYQFGFCFVQ